MGQIDKKDQLLQMYPVERNRMNKGYMKLFRRLLNTTVLNSLIICRKNIGWKVSCFKFRVDLIEGILVKCQVEKVRTVL
jgi:hypothetical protein